MLDAGRRTAIVFTICLSLIGLSSCLARRRVITRKGAKATQVLLTASKQTLMERIGHQYNSINSFSATVDMVPALGSANKGKITEYKDVRAYILYRKPADIRIIGLYPVVRNTAFDMASNGTDFRLYIPAANKFIQGRNQVDQPSPRKIENLRPQHFLEALLVRPVEKRELSVLEDFTDEDNAAYILHILDPLPRGELDLSRNVWFERLALNMARQKVFDASGALLTDARYSDWTRFDGVPFPKHIEINRPKDEYGVVIDVVKMEINKPLSNDKFLLNRPEGTQLQVLGDKTKVQEIQSSVPPQPKVERRRPKK